MDYRREIDGLRALAVVPVILFHAGFHAFSGGFVGVDVFFVISGYLITTIILSELDQDRFSIVTFYERRARRILPALFFMMAVCVPLSWLWLLPLDMRDFSRSLAAVPLFVSNILFWRESGYFEAAAELKPLLHTWSLAVEEHYYVVFPLFLAWTWKLGRRRILSMLAVVFVGSLVLAQWGSQAYPNPTFFLLPTRGWELLIGAFAAFHLSKARPDAVGRGLAEAGGWLGVAMVVYAIVAFDSSTPFPGLYALVPALGTVFIILFATERTTVGRAIGNPVFVGIGLISYSAYLWHQPLFAFARHASLHQPGPMVYAGLSVASLVLAWFSWRFIESPFRSKARVSRRAVFTFSVVVSAVFVAYGLTGALTQGMFRAHAGDDPLIRLGERMGPNYGLNAACEGTYTDSPLCQTGPAPEVLLWGDSTAMHLVQGLLASGTDVQMIQKTVSSCGPLLDVGPYPHMRVWSEKCMAVNDQVFDYLKRTPSIKYVVLSSLFDQYVADDATVLTRSGEVVPGAEVSKAAMVSTIERIRALGKTPVLFSLPPRDGSNIGHCLRKATQFGIDLSRCDIRAADSRSRNAPVYALLDELSKSTPVVMLDDALCADGTCKAAVDGVLIYRDGGHLTHEGSAWAGRKLQFMQRLEDAAAR